MLYIFFGRFQLSWVLTIFWETVRINLVLILRKALLFPHGGVKHIFHIPAGGQIFVRAQFEEY